MNENELYCEHAKEYVKPKLYQCLNNQYCETKFAYADIYFCNIPLLKSLEKEAEARGKLVLDELLNENEVYPGA